MEPGISHLRDAEGGLDIDWDDEPGWDAPLLDGLTLDSLDGDFPADATDKDGDGIPDDADPCPLYAEDPDGFEDDDGCPDDDNDGDGIADVDDLCPDEFETPNGFADDDGCPDHVSVTIDGPVATVDEERGRIDISENVYFDTGTSILRPESFAVLNKVATLLMTRPDLARVEVQGHTDERGDAGVNRRLSQERADAVRQYLINLGVDEERLSAVGYGPDRPLDPGHDENAWSTNRRVEFHLGE